MQDMYDKIKFMSKKAVRTIAYMITVVMASAALTGCGLVPSLNITDEQRTLIAEYAAGKLIEYAKGHPGGLMILEDVDRSEVNPGLKKEEEPSPDEAMLPGMPEQLPAPQEPVAGDGGAVDAPSDDTDDAAIVDSPVDIDSVPSKSLGEVLDIPEADITYNFYEICPTYPDNSAELAFSMKAATGKELLVLHFNVTNPTGSDIVAHTDSTDFKVRMVVNGTDKIRGDVTFLDNDLMNYDAVITPGASAEAVLVFEVAKDTEVSTMDLLVITDGEEHQYNII